jgi:hypothetical protein
LALFVVDLSPEQGDLVSLPYELLPLPRNGEIVDARSRKGEIICEGEVTRVIDPRKNRNTAVVTLLVPKGYGMEVRSFTIKGKNHE